MAKSDAAQRKDLLAQAQVSEKAGDYEGAAFCYAQAGAMDDAARLYLAANKFADAGRILLKSIGYDRRRTTTLEPGQRKAALKAAICFGRGGDVPQAVELYLVLGERARAAELLRSVGDFVNASRVESQSGQVELLGHGVPGGEDGVTMKGAEALEKAGKREAALEAFAHLKQYAHAARLAQALDKVAEAAGFYLQANLPLEAGLCFAQLGDFPQALKMLVQIARDHPRYREACIHAIRAADEINRLDFQLDNLMGRFLTAGPQDEAEAEAFYRLAGIYQRHGVAENARECLRKLVEKQPEHRDAADRLRALELDMRGSSREIERVYAEDEEFRSAVARHETPVAPAEVGDDEGLPALPDLPDLPDGQGAAPSQAAVERAATIAQGSVGSARLTPGGATRPAGQTVVQGASSGVPAGGPRRFNTAVADPRGGRVLSPLPVDPRTGRAITPPPIDVRSGRHATPGPVDPRMPRGTPPLAFPRPGRFATPQAVNLPPLRGTPGQIPTGSMPVVAEPSGAFSLPGEPGSGAPTALHGAVTPAPVTLTEGALVNNRYRLEKKIGQGGMGAVFKAIDLELDEAVAIKFLSAAVADDALLQRFKQEVSLSRQFNHPNIIRLYDLGTWGEHRFITMELLNGRDLSKVMTEPLDLDRGLGYLVQALTALQIVHDRGVIHRDIKPENFFVTDDGVVKVMDFGIAKRHNTSKGLTRAGMMAGTPQYMAPEQINDFGSVNHLADIYSMGVIAYQVFTGAVPFDNEELMPILVAHLTQAPDAPSKKNPRIPPDLEGIILKLLAKKPPERIQSCREVGGELARIRMQLAAKR